MSERCSNCGRAGHAVPLTLVRHHVIGAWLGRLEEKDFRFCEAPGCDVVYFEVQGVTVGTRDVRRAPAYKTGRAGDLLCFCFDVSGDDAAGDPDPTPFVRERVRRGECACDVLNPSGACCLGSIGRWKKAIAKR